MTGCSPPPVPEWTPDRRSTYVSSVSMSSMFRGSRSRTTSSPVGRLPHRNFPQHLENAVGICEGESRMSTSSVHGGLTASGGTTSRFTAVFVIFLRYLCVCRRSPIAGASSPLTGVLAPTRQRWSVRGISSDVNSAITFVSRAVGGERTNLRTKGLCAGRGPKPRDADEKHILILMIRAAHTLPCCMRNGPRVSASRRSTAASPAVTASRSRATARFALGPGAGRGTCGTVGCRRGDSLCPRR